MSIKQELVDIHTHILPGLDDGPTDFAEARALLQHMAHIGVTSAFCTPHYLNPHFDVDRTDMTQCFRTLIEEMDVKPNVNSPALALGAEVRVTQSVLYEIAADSIPHLGDTKYVLLELPTTSIPSITYDVLYELQIRDIVPIIAHPERNIPLQEQPHIINSLLNAGALLQLSADSFVLSSLGHTRLAHKARKFAWQLLSEGKSAILASDAHNISTRPPLLCEAYETIENELGELFATRLAENSRLAWRGETCETVQVHGPAWSI